MVIEAVVFAIVIVVGLTFLMLRATQRHQKCPACGERALAFDPENHRTRRGRALDGRAIDITVWAYRCEGCGEEFRDRNHTGMVTRAEFEDSAR